MYLFNKKKYFKHIFYTKVFGTHFVVEKRTCLPLCIGHLSSYILQHFGQYTRRGAGHLPTMCVSPHFRQDIGSTDVAYIFDVL